MSDTARLTSHPRDPRSALLNIGSAHNPTMGRFAPARWASDLKAYLVNDENVEALVRFLGLEGVHVTDDRGRAPGSGPGPLPECGNPDCRQPVRRGQEPEFCPGCGQQWVTHHAEIRGHGWRAEPRVCDTCGLEQRGIFRFCQGCGHVMPEPVRHGRPQTREHLDNPIPVGDAIADWIDENRPDNADQVVH